MTVTEESRHRLHQALDHAIGPEEATTLMEHLPPVGWADVATKTDLTHLGDTLRAEMDHRFDVVDLKLAAVDQRFDDLTTAMDQRFTAIEVTLGVIQQRLDSIDNRMGQQLWQVLAFLMTFVALVVGVLLAT
ncbi:MAG TPA: hypothetical protein VFU19_04260 [Iamia sp.]|nr:hypothetical protein [Iamia sp.]